MNEDVKHVAIAEIYYAAEQIQYQADSWDIRDSNSSQYPAICEMVKRIQYLDSLLHDELYPQGKEGAENAQVNRR